MVVQSATMVMVVVAGIAAFAREAAEWQGRVQAAGVALPSTAREPCLHRMVVLPALSRPRMRMRTSLLPNKEENTLLKSMPIFGGDRDGTPVRS